MSQNNDQVNIPLMQYKLKLYFNWALVASAIALGQTFAVIVLIAKSVQGN